jgi:hypothetical protein
MCEAMVYRVICMVYRVICQTISNPLAVFNTGQRKFLLID